MKSLMALTTASVIASTTMSQAFCSRGYGYDFSSQVTNELEYLLCLHNEQVRSLNTQGDLINGHADAINDLSERQRRIGYVLDELASAIGALESSVNNQERRINDLEYQLQILQ